MICVTVCCWYQRFVWLVTRWGRCAAADNSDDNSDDITIHDEGDDDEDNDDPKPSDNS